MDNDKIIEIVMNINTVVARVEGKIDCINNSHETLEKRVKKLEDSQTWLVRTILAIIITEILGFIMK